MENPPIITLVDDEEDDSIDEIHLESDTISIEELENAVLKENDSEEQIDKMDMLHEETKITNRLIPIQLENGDILNPKFESLEELVPPPWSIFHKSNAARARNVKLSTSSSQESSENSDKRQFSTSSDKDEDIEKIMDEFEVLGKLPLNTEDQMHFDENG